MDWLKAMMGQQIGGTSAVGESYLTEMDRMKQMKMMMETLRNKGVNSNRQDQMIGGGATDGFGQRPGILVPGNNVGTALADLLQTGMGQYGANKADEGIADLAHRNDKEFATALREGDVWDYSGNQDGMRSNFGNFPKALPRLLSAQGATRGVLTPATATPTTPANPSASAARDSSFTESPILPDEKDEIAKMRRWGLSDSDISEVMTTRAKVNSKIASPPATPAKYEAPEPGVEIPEPDVEAISASIPASGNMEPMMTGREKWMIKMAHNFPKSAASMNSMLQAESNMRRDRESHPLKIALAEIRINQAADLAASRARSAEELAAIKHAQAQELEKLRQEGRDRHKAIIPGKAPSTPKAAGSGGKDSAGVAQAAGNELVSSFKTLKALNDAVKNSGGAVRTGGDVLKNIANSALSTEVGQGVGRAFGTKAQQSRDEISSLIPQMLIEIKNAKNMPAAMLNSNVELKLALEQFGRPGFSYEAKTATLDRAIKKWEAAAKSSNFQSTNSEKVVVKEVQLKDGRIGVEYEDGTRGYKE